MTSNGFRDADPSRGPFSPGGEFVQNIRSIGGDDTELRESLKAFGWRPEFPALADENGVVLVGNRRIKIAKELGIEPVMETVNFGRGDAADAERFKLAIASNIGFQSMTREDRKRIATHLYGTQEWTMQRIAEALSVAISTVHRDLGNFSKVEKLNMHSKTDTNPKGAGRPKGTLRPNLRKNTTPQAEAAAKIVLDEGKTYAEAEARTGLSETVVRSAVAREEGRREATAQPSPVDPGAMSHSMRARYEATIAKLTKELTFKITAEVREQVRREWDEIYLPEYRQRLARADRILDNFKGLISRQDFRKIKACLHPDHNSFQFAADALQIFSELEDRLVKPEPKPINAPPLPQTVAELMAMRDAATAQRRAARAQQKTGR